MTNKVQCVHVYFSFANLSASLQVCLFDLMLYVHDKLLRSCRDCQLLNHTVLRQASQRQFTRIKCPFFCQKLTTYSSCISGRGNLFSTKNVQDARVDLGTAACEADSLPSYRAPSSLLVRQAKLNAHTVWI